MEFWYQTVDQNEWGHLGCRIFHGVASSWVSRELRRHRTKLGRLNLPLLLVCKVLIPNLDQPNHLFLWACSQTTKCNWRKLAEKQIYNFQAQLDHPCCSAILLLIHDWFLFPFSIAALPICYLPFQDSNLLSPFMHAVRHLLSTYYILSTFIRIRRR